MSRTQELKAKIDTLKNQLSAAQNELAGIERNCRHEWNEPQYTPEYRPGYTEPGDTPGTMGIDWRGSCYVTAETIPKWTRTCRICGKTETTTRSEPVIAKQRPLF